jgi:asparagine synthase (glutamine-hydrolysing)
LAFGGDFSFVAYHVENRSITVGRSLLGARSLVYERAPRALRIASEPRQIHAASGMAPRPNAEAIADVLLDRPLEGRATLFERILAFPAASLRKLERWNHGREVVPWAWTPPAPVEEGLERCEALAPQLRLLLCRVVSDALRQGCVVELSSGVDSAAIWGIARSIGESAFGGTPRAVTMVAEGRSWDEGKWVRADWGARNGDGHIYLETGQRASLEEVGRLFALLPRPMSPTIADGAWMGQVASDQGIHALVSGAGGDEWFRGNLSYLARGLLKGKLKSWLADARQFAIPEGRTRWRYLVANGASPRLPSLRAATLRWLSMARPATSGCLLDSRRRPALAWRSSSWRSEILETLRYLQSSFSLAAVETVTASVGVEHRHPLLDRRVVEFALRVPERAFTGGRVWKHLLRTAVADFVPSPCLERTTKVLLDEVLRREILELGRSYAASGWMLADLGIVRPPNQLAFSSESDHTTAALGVDPCSLVLAELWCREQFGR